MLVFFFFLWVIILDFPANHAVALVFLVKSNRWWCCPLWQCRAVAGATAGSISVVGSGIGALLACFRTCLGLGGADVGACEPWSAPRRHGRQHHYRPLTTASPTSVSISDTLTFLAFYYNTPHKFHVKQG
jgi:hypothetical protein